MKIKDLDKVIKIYFYLNIFIVSLTSFFVPNLLRIYYNFYVFGNITSEGHYLDSINSRGIGLLGHPAWLALMVYMLGKYLAIKENRYRYVLLSVVAITLSNGRAALFTLIILETYFLVFKKRKNSFKFFLEIYLVQYCWRL